MPLYKGDVHVNAPLTNMAVGYAQQGLIADVLFPRLPSKKDSNVFYVFGTTGKREVGGFGNAPAASFAWEDGSDYNVNNWARETKTFTCIQRAAASELTVSELRNQDRPPLDAFRDHTFEATEDLRRELEKLAATKATTQANYPASNRTQLATTAQWSDHSAGVSDPYKDIVTGANAVRQQTYGNWPNVLACSAAAWIQLITHPDVMGVIQHTNPNLPTEMAVATMFRAVGIERVVVAGGVSNSADRGASESLADIWGKHVVLAYVNPRPSIGMRSYGYRFNSSNDLEVERNDIGKRATVINVVSRDTYEFICRDTNADAIAGYLIEDAVA